MRRKNRGRLITEEGGRGQRNRGEVCVEERYGAGEGQRQIKCRNRGSGEIGTIEGQGQ